MFGDIDNIVVVHIHYGGANQLGGKVGEVAAVLVENLDAVVFAVGNKQAGFAVNPSAVGQVELAGAGAGAAPGFDELAVRGEVVDAGVGVAIGDKDFAGGVDGDAGRKVEGFSATHHIGPSVGTDDGIVHASVGAVALDANGHQQLPLLSEFHNLAVVAFDQPDVIVRVDDDGVGEAEHSRAPGVEVVALPVENDDGMVGVAVEAIDPVLGVAINGSGGHGPAGGELGPMGVHFVGVLAGANDGISGSQGAPPWGQDGAAAGFAGVIMAGMGMKVKCG